MQSAKLKEKIPFKFKFHVKNLLTKKNKLEILKKDLKVVVALAADYGNLGDVAITKAQITLLKDVFPNHKIVTIHINEIHNTLVPLKRLINKDDVITIIGGGNMGDLYGSFEQYRRTLIEIFPDNKIVSFPQTIDFSKGLKGQNALNKSIEIYSKHSNLYIFARESKSFKLMENAFKNNTVHMVPDIVLYLNETEPSFSRDGIVLCLRDDAEKKISTNDKERLINLVNQKYGTAKYYDTHIGDENYSKELADAELEKIWTTFKQSKVVITDRLHGMIFCAITQTPCIVLPNSNHKIAGTYYDWLSTLDYIKFFEDYDENLILNSIEKLYTEESIVDEPLDLKNKYQYLIESLKK
ncbi:polysaccharide pyruvyl transferase family protein [Priestia megaterium]|uniref:polysaccharide pyruvyl transferase family protein n=1 Tax=Priestia megaterium TaxID=1404 RepID=UPI001C238EF7|nr:polysaccharide pyruvyl transferase family protein [Priestia megaterium]MBU8586942.1 polysaccharide pyruvyl transferase family protein [Priestia megaterium]